MPASPESMPRSDIWKGYILAAFAASFWATGGLVAKWLFVPLDATTRAWTVPPPGIETQPMTLAGARAVVAALLLLSFVALRRPRALRVAWRDVPFLVFFGVGALAMVHVAYFQTISHTNVATAILLEYLAPVLVLVFSVGFLGERLTWALPVGVALSLGGCALVVGAVGSRTLVVSREAIGWGLASAVFFALYSLLGKAATRFSPWTLLAYGLGSAAVFWVLYIGPAPIAGLLSDRIGAACVLYMAVFATILPFGAFLKALHFIDATKAIVTSTLEPVLAGGAAYLAFGESFTALQLLGGLLVIAAIAVVQRESLAAQPSVPPAP